MASQKEEVIGLAAPKTHGLDQALTLRLAKGARIIFIDSCFVQEVN